MEELLNRLAAAESKLRMDSQKLKGQLLKEQIAELETKKTDYEIQLNEANLSIPEARDRILARMKEDNSSIANMEKRYLSPEIASKKSRRTLISMRRS